MRATGIVRRIDELGRVVIPKEIRRTLRIREGDPLEIYTDRDGDLVTSIVGGKDCVFTCYEGDCCLCALERAYRQGKTQFIKPISCALYPIREKRFKDGTVALNYNRWDVCEDAVKKGKELGLRVYRFLEGPLVRRFGQEWYDELCAVADEYIKAYK